MGTGSRYRFLLHFETSSREDCASIFRNALAADCFHVGGSAVKASINRHDLEVNYG